MSGWLALAAVALAATSGLPSLFLPARSPGGGRLAALLLGLGSAFGIAAAVLALTSSVVPAVSLPWPVPGWTFEVRVDALSAAFLLQIFVISPLASVYGLAYWPGAEHPDNARSLRLFHGALTAGMALLVVAGNSLVFLAGWEIMAIAAFLALSVEHREAAVRDGSYVYLGATRVGTLSLIAMFVLLWMRNGSPDFTAAPGTGATDTAIFLLGLVGFGLKAGLMPFHLWLPSAHANAPSHISALMSGVLIKMGVYGVLRLLTLYPSPPLWWGLLLLVLGVVSAVLGVAFAIGQHDVKRLLAYHSVENIGIIFMGLGLGALGTTLNSPVLETLGFAGAVLHTWNHGLFKSLLFLSGGAVVHACGTREIDRLGGLLKVMPHTGAAFLLGAVAICGLPPLNGFISELFIYLGLFHGVAETPGGLFVLFAFAAPALALVGALAVACFVKVFGAVFLGESRSRHTAHAHEPGPTMRVPMYVLGALCVLIGLGPVLVAPLLDRAVAVLAPGAEPLATLVPFPWLSLAAAILLVLVGVIALFLRARLRGRTAAPTGTWDCGYAAPSATMQYTASSFAELLVGLFGWALRPRTHLPHVAGLFPGPAHFESHVPEPILDGVARPTVTAVGRAFAWVRQRQGTSVHAYILLTMLTLLVLLVYGTMG